MDRSTPNRVVLALLVICSALLVAPALGGTPQEIVSWGIKDGSYNDGYSGKLAPNLLLQ